MLSTALLTNGILWMYTSLQIGKTQNNGIKNETLKNMACYVESNIYQNILSHTLGISLQTHLNYFLLCVGLTASTLPSGSSLADESDTLGWSQNSNRKLHRKKIISEGNKFPDLIFMFVSLASFLPSLVVVILQELARADSSPRLRCSNIFERMVFIYRDMSNDFPNHSSLQRFASY